jgi:hypothetical protein
VHVRHGGYDLIFDSKVRLIHLAIPTGGCENRTTQHAERRFQQHCHFYPFFQKSHAVVGLLTSLSVCAAYGQLNRSVSGSWRLVNMNWMFLRSLIGVLRLSRVPSLQAVRDRATSLSTSARRTSL